MKKNGPNSFPSPLSPIVKQLPARTAAPRKVVPSLQFSGTLSPSKGFSVRKILATLNPHKKSTSNSQRRLHPMMPVVTNPNKFTPRISSLLAVHFLYLLM